MAVDKPVQVKGATISSPSPIVSFASGLDERGDYNISPDAFSVGRNAMVNSANNATKRLSKKKWLPDSVGFNGEASTVYYDGEIYYFIADDGKIKYCQENDTSWTDCGGSNTITTTTDTITTFLRVNDLLLAMNGVDPLSYVDLSTFNVNAFTHVDDPISVITCAATGISGSGSYNVYYAFNYNSDGGGTTAIGPIKTQAVSKSRSNWKTDGTEYLTVSFNDTPPAGATSRNLYAAVYLKGATPTASDLLMLQPNIPLATTSFVDNGSAMLDIGYDFAPDTNTTEGIKASQGQLVDKTPILYGDPTNPYTIYFGAIVDDSVAFGGIGTQALPLLKGTNYYPTSVIGFRNNQGIPNLLALFSGTEGVSKQQILSKTTVTYGDEPAEVWKPDELNAGAAAVYAKYGVVPYLGELQFPSADGIISIKTEQQLQNVLQPSIVSDAVAKTYNTIKNANFKKIVGASWKNLVCFTIPSRGYNYNNQILVRDMTNRDKPKNYVWDIAADWIGSISPPDKDSFLYIREGNKFFKLVDSYVAEDEDSTGVSTPYPVIIESALIPFSQAKNSYFAATQAVVYLANFIGTVDITISYVTKKGKIKTKTKTFTNGGHSRNRLAGWSNPRLLWRSWNNRMVNWSTPIPSSGEQNNTQKVVRRCRIRLPNPVINEYKVRVSSDLSNTSFDVVGAALEGVNIGPIGDIV